MPNSDQLRIGVVIEKSTHIKIIKEMQRTSINGVLLDITNFNIEEVSEALNHLTAGKSYWPKHILAQLPGNRPTAANTNAIKLTARQEQIATLICQRGLSNKKVANMLTITESTVKAHVSAILKAYGVRNRTQLVLSAVKDHRA
jgi:DNA-binding NarL/FixJ family response regulator